jgi:hypothetical protein
VARHKDIDLVNEESEEKMTELTWRLVSTSGSVLTGMSSVGSSNGNIGRAKS